MEKNCSRAAEKAIHSGYAAIVERDGWDRLMENKKLNILLAEYINRNLGAVSYTHLDVYKRQLRTYISGKRKYFR